MSSDIYNVSVDGKEIIQLTDTPYNEGDMSLLKRHLILRVYMTESV